MRTPNTYQKELAAKLGIDISRDSHRVATARIQEAVHPAISSKPEAPTVTPEQIHLAWKYRLHVDGDSRRVAAAKIQDRREQLSRKLVREMGLKPGDRMVFKIDLVNGIVDPKTICVVRRIGDNGVIYFQGRRRAWPDQLKKLSEEEDTQSERNSVLEYSYMDRSN